MSDHPIESMMNTTMEKIKTMVDASTMIGDPITTPDGTVIISVSKVSYGFASGGSDFVSKNAASKDLFGGGAGAAAVCGLGLAILGRRAAGVRRAAHAVERHGLVERNAVFPESACDIHFVKRYRVLFVHIIVLSRDKNFKSQYDFLGSTRIPQNSQNW